MNLLGISKYFLDELFNMVFFSGFPGCFGSIYNSKRLSNSFFLNTEKLLQYGSLRVSWILNKTAALASESAEKG